jgi:hypothetical protein
MYIPYAYAREVLLSQTLLLKSFPFAHRIDITLPEVNKALIAQTGSDVALFIGAIPI